MRAQRRQAAHKHSNPQAQPTHLALLKVMAEMAFKSDIMVGYLSCYVSTKADLQADNLRGNLIKQ